MCFSDLSGVDPDGGAGSACRTLGRGRRARLRACSHPVTRAFIFLEERWRARGSLPGSKRSIPGVWVSPRPSVPAAPRLPALSSRAGLRGFWPSSTHTAAAAAITPVPWVANHGRGGEAFFFSFLVSMVRLFSLVCFQNSNYFFKKNLVAK